MRIQQTTGALLLMLGLFVGCHRPYQFTGQQYKRLTIDEKAAADSGTAALLRPYKQKLDQSMNEVLTVTSAALDKKKPESGFTNMLTDMLLERAQQKYNKPVDVAHMNFSGVRSGLPKGNITVGNVFEVMPFDNLLVVVTVKGSMLMQFLNHFAQHEDVLVVGGIRVIMKDKTVQSVTFNNGRTFDPNQTYTIAMSDYVANGGSDASFLSNAVARDNVNYLIRDAFIEAIRQQGKSGQPLNPQTDGRITIQ
nr:5'-nucleotidase C-terminal domain-containing protein [uncultured Arsenicibacter sp.]